MTGSEKKHWSNKIKMILLTTPNVCICVYKIRWKFDL